MICSSTHNGVQMVCKAVQRFGGYVGVATFDGCVVYAPSDAGEPPYPTMVSALEAAEKVGRMAIDIGAYAPRRERHRSVRSGVYMAMQTHA